MGDLWLQLRNETQSLHWQGLAEQRRVAIEEMLWHPMEQRWIDYDLTQGNSTRPFYISDLSPLWYSAHRFNDTQVIQLLDRYSDFIEGWPGGIPISKRVTGEQWDFPNVWAPVQFQLTRLLLDLESRVSNATLKEQLHAKSVSIAQRFVTSAYCGYVRFGCLFEKYHAEQVGLPGGGGEYVVQEGFGWTNGALLWMFKRLPAELHLPKCPDLATRLNATQPKSPASPRLLYLMAVREMHQEQAHWLNLHWRWIGALTVALVFTALASLHLFHRHLGHGPHHMMPQYL